MLLLYYGYRLLTVARVMGSKNLKTLVCWPCGEIFGI